MTYRYGRSGELVSLDRGRLSWKLFALTLSSVAALALSGVIGVIAIYGHPDTTTADVNPNPADNAKVVGLRGSEDQPGILPAIRPASEQRQAEAANTYGHLLDLTFELGNAPVTLAQSHPLAAAFALVSPQSTQIAEEAQQLVPMPVPQDSDLVANVPLPAPRPADLTFSPSHGQLRAHQQQQTTTVAAAPDSDNRSIFDKLFGGQQPSGGGQTLAYASAEDGLGGLSGLLGGGDDPKAAQAAQAIASSFGQSTAVYDITDHTVFMPDGRRLEAHSGLGDQMDDPHYVAVKMRGPTPPHVYDLQPREQLFHGVQALRLIPVGGDADVYGRAGLLAHSYMLGPYGASNGCVSFKDYNAFLDAYLHGEVKRLVVVAGI